MSKFQERLRKQREEEILSVAYTLLAERGYERMTMDEIASQVGISKVTLYQHFASKEALAAGIAVEQMRRIEQALEQYYRAERPALERLQAVLRYSLEQQAPKWVANLPPNARFVVQDPAFQALYAQRMNEWEGLVEQAKSEGSIDPAISTAVLVRMMQQLFAPGYEDLVQRGRATPEEIIQTLMTIIVRGASANLSQHNASRPGL